MRHFCLYVALGLGAAAQAHADASDPVLRADVSPRCALEVDLRRDEAAACWRLDCLDAQPKALGCDLTALHQVVEVLIDPSGKWMAVTTVGEGHPILEIVPIQDWLGGKDYRAQCSVNPYPGTFDIDGWKAGGLRLSSDVDLSIADADSRAGSFGDERVFRIAPQDCTVTTETGG
jgi:hypothetical protein